jgi:hypothetical protein
MLLLAGLLWKVPLDGAIKGMRALSPLGVTAIVVLTFAFPAIAAARWKRALSALGEEQSWLSLFADSLVASTYNMLLPTSVGGDVVRAIRCGRRLKSPHHAWSSTLFERLVGVVALIIMAVPGLAFAKGNLGWLGVLVGLCLAASIALIFLAPAPFRVAARLLVQRAPKLAGLGDGIADDLSGSLSKVRIRFELIFWSLLYQAVGLGVLVVVAFDWGHPEMSWAILGGVPLALVATMLPVSIAGLGLRESLFVVLLARFGIASGHSLSLAIVWLASALLLALAGALVLLIESSRGLARRAHLS